MAVIGSGTTFLTGDKLLCISGGLNFSGRSAAAFLFSVQREKMTDVLLRFRDVTRGLQDGRRESPFAASLSEPSMDFFWRAKSVRSTQTILRTADHIRREVFPVGFAFADGLE